MKRAYKMRKNKCKPCIKGVESTYKGLLQLQNKNKPIFKNGQQGLERELGG